jgi:hypothetical protein
VGTNYDGPKPRASKAKPPELDAMSDAELEAEVDGLAIVPWHVIRDEFGGDLEAARQHFAPLQRDKMRQLARAMRLEQRAKGGDS